MRLVTGVSRVTSEAGNPDEGVSTSSIFGNQIGLCHTNITGQDKEIIISQGTVLVRVKQGVDIQTISGRIVPLKDLQGLGVVLDLSLGVEEALGIAVGDSHGDIWENTNIRELRGIKE